MRRHFTAQRGYRSTGELFPELSEVLAPEYADLPPERLERLLRGSLCEVSLEDVESFWSGLKSFGKQVGSFARQALPGVGTAVGTMFGGPLGAQLGGTLGGLASQGLGAAMGSGGRRRRPGAPPPAGGSPAAAQLLNVMTRPQTMQALLSMAMGKAGTPNVRVHDTPVPPAAIANLLGMLANNAAAEYHQAVAGELSGTPRYLLDEAGELVCDPVDPNARAQVLLELFQEAWEAEGSAELDEAEEDLQEWDEAEEDVPEWEAAWTDDFESELELIELYGEED